VFSSPAETLHYPRNFQMTQQASRYLLPVGWIPRGWAPKPVKTGLPKEAIRVIFAWHGKTQWVPVGLWVPGGCGFSFLSTKVLGIGLAQGIGFVMDMFLPNLPRTCPVAIPMCVRQCAFYHQWSKGVRDRVDHL
jgi:hypothetical protein